MSFEQSPLTDIFALIDHTKVATKTLDFSAFTDDGESTIRDMIISESKLEFGDESVMKRIVDMMGGPEAFGDKSYLNAFFGGTLFALLVADELASEKLGDSARYRERLLSKGDNFLMPESASDEAFDVYQATGLCSYTVEPAYTEALERITPLIMPAEQEELFFAGFAYALMAAKASITELVLERIAEQSNISDYDIAEFLKDIDLTGSLQEVYSAYIDHLVALGIDPADISDNDAERLLNLTLIDYVRLVPDIQEVEIQGPSYITLIEPDGSLPMPIMLHENSKLVGDVGAFAMTIAPADPSYIQKDDVNQFVTTFMPSFAIKTGSFTNPLGETTAIEAGQTVYVGIAVPLTKYRSVL